jgi:hypothetical protein
MTTGSGLLRAYRETLYSVDGVRFRVGEHNRLLAGLLEPALTAGFLTACNPFSRKTGRAENERANDALRADLEERCLAVMKGDGTLGDWREPMWLGIGLGYGETLLLGRRYRQNAVVFILEGRTSLILCADQSPPAFPAGGIAL